VIDESHATVPQIGGMYEGDKSRKTVLVEHGFRLPSALDNRPLAFEEFQSMQGQTVYVSATPGPRELEWSRESALGLKSSLARLPRPATKERDEGAGSAGAPGVAEQIVRP